MKKLRFILVISLVVLAGIIFINLRYKRAKINDTSMLPGIQTGQSVRISKTNPNKIIRGEKIAFYSPEHSDIKIKDKPINVSRLIAFPEDTILIEKKDIYVNGQLFQIQEPLFFKYRISTKLSFNQKALNEFDVIEIKQIAKGFAYELICTPETASKLETLDGVTTVRLLWDIRYTSSTDIFPTRQSKFSWNKDYFGPFIIPYKGMGVDIIYNNYGLYERIINTYEENSAYIQSRKIYIDGKQLKHYKIKSNYYFVINDNRENISDSRTLGPIPEDHIIGIIK